MFESFLSNFKYKQLDGITTPFFVFDRVLLKKKALVHRQLMDRANCKLLYAVKAASNLTILRDLIPFIDGFSVSSLFETQISDLSCHGIANMKKDILYVSPAIREREWNNLQKYINFMSFNTLEQLASFQDKLLPHVEYGVRLDSELVFLNYDYGSDNMPPKLGVPLNNFLYFLENHPELSRKITGIHIHNAHMNSNLSQLEETF